MHSLDQPRSSTGGCRPLDATCSIRVIVPFARYLMRIGGDCEALLRRHGLTMAALDERDRRVPHTDASALLKDLIELSGDPAIGLHAARCEERGDFDVVEYAAANCKTVGEALQLAAHFMALWHDGLFMELVDVPPMVALRVRGVGGLEHAPAGIEFLFASLLSYGSRSVGHPTRPQWVEFTHQAPADTRIYEKTFREVRFGCAANAMWLNSSALDVPHCAPDPSLLQILTTHADGLLRELARPAGFAGRARAEIEKKLTDSGAEQVARRLGMSSRTLHRRLSEEGTSHGELLDDVRRKQAMEHLTHNRFSISEIAFLLGFAHPNGFHKAFKRWTGMPPAQYRENAQSGRR